MVVGSHRVKTQEGYGLRILPNPANAVNYWSMICSLFRILRLRRVPAVLAVVTALLSVEFSALLVVADETEADKEVPEKAVDSAAAQRAEQSLPATADEARGRARWLHETIHGSLQVMHRDFFGTGEDDISLPSQSLEDVFRQLAESWKVEIRWLGVNATKDQEHEPQDDFEKAAAKALAAGETEYDAVERGKFRFVGTIRMQNECLKCHVPLRTSLEDRVAGLAISIPLRPPTENASSINQANEQ